MIVDAWIQHPTAELLSHEMFSSLRRWMGLDEIPESIPAEVTLLAMDAAGVDVGVLSSWYGPTGELIGHDVVQEVIALAPERFVGLASVDPRHPMEAIERLRHAVEELGFRGLRFLPWLWEMELTDRLLYPLYACCVELGVPFCVQVGHTGPMRPSVYGRPIPGLEQVALDFPELTIVAGHIGVPWHEEMIFLARKFDNVYIDTSAYKPKRYPVSVVEYMRQSSCAKVLFGSNYPMIRPGTCLAQLEVLALGEEASARFLGGNAARIFNLSMPSERVPAQGDHGEESS